MKKFLTILALSLAMMTSRSHAQENLKSQVRGVIGDKATNSILAGAVITIKDTNIGDISNDKGEFNVRNLDMNKKVTLDISFNGYRDMTVNIELDREIVILPDTIFLRPKALRVKDVTVVGSSPIATMKGDTISFSAGAYKTNPDASAGDLIAKMPGFEQNEDGSISSNGEKVERIYVDGKSFFKDDLATALNALTADMVESIDLFDDATDEAKFTGFDNGDKVTSINIVTKNKLGNKPATLFEVSGGGGFGLGDGTTDVYTASFRYTKLNGDRQISILGGSNNMNIAPTQQMRGFSRDRGGSGGGISDQTGIAINYTNAALNDGEINVSYSYNRKDSYVDAQVYSSYFATDDYDDYYTTSSSISNSISNTHRLNFNFETNVGEKVRITFKPTVTLSYSESDATSVSDSYMDGDVVTSDRTTSSEPDSYSVSGNLVAMRKFSGKNYLVLKAKGSFSDSSSDSYIVSETDYAYLNNLQDTTESQNQMSEILNGQNSVSLGIDFTQRISTKSAVTLGYEVGYNWSDYDKKTYVWNEDDQAFEDIIDSDLSNMFSRDYLTNSAGLRYNYKITNASFNLDVKYRNAQLHSNRTLPNAFEDDYTFHGAVINGGLTFNLGKKKSTEENSEDDDRSRMRDAEGMSEGGPGGGGPGGGGPGGGGGRGGGGRSAANGSGSSLSIMYTGTPGYPSVTQLQDVMDNDDPLNLSSGNPDLDQSFSHKLRVQFRGVSIEKNLFYGAFASISNTQNGIVNNTILIQSDTVLTVGKIDYDVLSGAKYTTLTNMNGTWDAQLGGSFSFSLNPISTKVNLMAMYNYQKQPSMYNNIDYSSVTNGYTLNIGLNSNISSDIDFSLRNKINYRTTASTRTTSENYLTNTATLSLYVNLYRGIFLSTDFSMVYQKLTYTPLDDPYTILLNGSLGKKFFNNSFEVRASIYDALNENINIVQSVSDIAISETTSNNLTRYLSFSISYKFNSIQKDFKDFRGGDRGMGGPGSGMGPGGDMGGPGGR